MVPSGVANLARPLRLSLAFARPLLVRLESPRAAAAAVAESQIQENPTGETSMCDVILLDDVSGPPGSAGVPTEEASPELRRARERAGKSYGTAARFYRALCLSYRSRAALSEARPRAHRRHGKERAPMLLSPAGARTT